ncbi:hypothetical protein K437DRAFT_259539, partial [Tilletiaria anomala UBC 951]
MQNCVFVCLLSSRIRTGLPVLGKGVKLLDSCPLASAREARNPGPDHLPCLCRPTCSANCYSFRKLTIIPLDSALISSTFVANSLDPGIRSSHTGALGDEL